MAMLNLPELVKEPIGHYPYFPTRQQLFIWRNWEAVSTEKIAHILGTDVQTVNTLAEEMGLPVPAKVNTEYLKRGFVTIIRNNWHVIPYDQLIDLLDTTRDDLAYTLKEDDFLSVKLLAKPDVEPVRYSPLTDEEKKQTAKLKEWNEKYFAKYRDKISVNDFDFIKDFGKPERIKKQAQKRAIEVNSFWNVKALTPSYNTDAYIKNFKKDVKKEWGINLDGSDKFIVLKIAPDSSKKEESHKIDFTKKAIEITAVDEPGLLKGLNYLLYIADKNEDFSFDEGCIVRNTRFDVRLIYSYNALYGDALLDGGEASYPDALLKEYSRIGINGVWIHAVLYKLVKFPFAPELSDGWEKRLEGLKKLVKRAGEYGIKIYLYLNEPRCMPMSFFDKYPELLGYSNGPDGSLCTSTPQVQQYLTDGVTQICNAAPDLGGFFTITASENFTNCYSHTNEPPCPRCSKRKPNEVLAEVNLLIARAARKINPLIKVLAWNWGWSGRFPSWEEMASNIGDEGVRVMCTSEEGVRKTIGGIETSVIDYSISLVGPGDNAKNIWKICREQNCKTMAKVQFNNTWECSTVPYIPVVDLVKKHMEGLVENKVDGLMIGWTLGGYPSMNLEIMSQYYWEGGNPKEGMFSIFGDKTPVIEEATATFSRAFNEFPFHIGTLYKGPQHMGPSNPLFEHNSHLYATMTGYPYDDIEQWRSIYPVEIFEDQLRKVSEIWKEGLDKLSSSLSEEDLKINKRTKEFLDIATATYCLFRSSYQQTAYIRARDAYDAENNEEIRSDLRKKILALLDAEIETAMLMYSVMIHNSTIGYEAANHYFFNKYSIMEKILNCEYLKTRFA